MLGYLTPEEYAEQQLEQIENQWKLGQSFADDLARLFGRTTDAEHPQLVRTRLQVIAQRP
jgi:hypothetical protein